MKPPRFVDPEISNIDVKARGKATAADVYLHLPKEAGSKLGPNKAIMEGEGIKGSEPGTGIHDASTIGRLNEKAERQQILKDTLGDDVRGWSAQRNRLAFRVAADVASSDELSEYAKDAQMRRVVTRARQLFTEAWNASKGDAASLKITGFHENYVPHVDPHNAKTLYKLMDWFRENSADLDVANPSKTRLEMRREGSDTGQPYRLTDAVEAYAAAIAKQRNLDPVNRAVLDQIKSVNEEALAAVKNTGRTPKPKIDDQTVQVMLDQQNHAFLGRPTAGELLLMRTPVVRQALAGALWTLDSMGYEVNRNKPVSTLARVGADVATMAQVSPIRAATSHGAWDIIKKVLSGKASGVPSEVVSGLAKRVQMMTGMDRELFEKYRDAGMVNDFWRLNPTDTKLRLIPRAVRAPFQFISFLDEAAKIGTLDSFNQKFVDAGMAKDVAWQRAILATIRQQNFTEALHMPNFFSTIPGEMYGLFNRSRLGAANDVVRWLKSKDGATYAKGLGVVGTLGMLSYVGVDAWQRIHVLPQIESGGGLEPAAVSMVHGMYKNFAAGKPQSTWVSRTMNPKGNTSGEKLLDIFGLRKKTEEEQKQLEFMRLHR